MENRCFKPVKKKSIVLCTIKTCEIVFTSMKECNLHVCRDKGVK